MPEMTMNKICHYKDWRIQLKKQKNKIKEISCKKKILQNHCRPIKRAAFFHRIGTRHK